MGSKSLGVSFSAMGIACSDIANIGVWNEVRINSVWSSRVGMSRVNFGLIFLISVRHIQ